MGDLRDILRSAEQLQALVTNVVAKLPTPAITVPDGLWPALEEIRVAGQAIRDKQRLDAFVEYGLCLPPSMPEYIAAECQLRHETGKDVAAFVLRYYRRNRWHPLREMVAAWKNHRFLGRRMHIIEEALWAHTRRRYAASVGLLIHQPEGIVLDWAAASGELEAVTDMEKERKQRGREPRNRPLDPEISPLYAAHLVTKVIGEISANSFTPQQWRSLQSLVRFCCDVLYRRNTPIIEHERMLQSDMLARHAISHGSALNAGTELNSLRLFLALDVLSLME